MHNCIMVHPTTDTITVPAPHDGLLSPASPQGDHRQHGSAPAPPGVGSTKPAANPHNALEHQAGWADAPKFMQNVQYPHQECRDVGEKEHIPLYVTHPALEETPGTLEHCPNQNNAFSDYHIGRTPTYIYLRTWNRYMTR